MFYTNITRALEHKTCFLLLLVSIFLLFSGSCGWRLLFLFRIFRGVLAVHMEKHENQRTVHTGDRPMTTTSTSQQFTSNNLFVSFSYAENSSRTAALHHNSPSTWLFKATKCSPTLFFFCHIFFNASPNNFQGNSTRKTIATKNCQAQMCRMTILSFC